MKKLIILFLLLPAVGYTADLSITSANNGSEGNPTVYDGGSYDRLIINGASYVTVKNASFLTENTEHGTGTRIAYITGSDNIILENNSLDGRDDGVESETICNGIDITGSSDILIDNNTITQVADDHFSIYGNSIRVTIRGNTVTEAYSNATYCSNGHSDAIEIGFATYLTVEDNFIWTEDATSALITGWDIDNLTIRNNVFYAPGTGFVVYIYGNPGYTMNTVKIYNNTFWNGLYGGIAVGGAEVNDLYIYNNILHNIHYNHFNWSEQQADHYIDNNLLGETGYGYTPNTNDIVDNNPEFTVAPVLDGTPLVSSTKEDFQLTATSPAIDEGTTGADVPSDDIAGNTRTAPPDIGAWEYGVSTPQSQGVFGSGFSIR